MSISAARDALPVAKISVKEAVLYTRAVQEIRRQSFTNCMEAISEVPVNAQKLPQVESDILMLALSQLPYEYNV